MKSLLLLILLVATGAARLNGDEGTSLRIALHEKPPYAMKNDAGEWEGIGVELWKSIAVKASLRYEFVELPYEDLIPALKDRRADVVVGEIGVSPDIARSVKFTQPFLISSIGVALPSTRWRPAWGAILSDLMNWTLLLVLGGIFAGMFLVSAVIWSIERHHHAGHFRGGVEGFGSALWFAAVTMTGVGYGDKTPSTFAGRLVAFLWLLLGVLLVAAFTASVASGLSAARTDDVISRSADLRGHICGVLNGSSAAQLLEKRGVALVKYEDFSRAFAALRAREIDMVVGDKVTLHYFAGRPVRRGARELFIPGLSLKDMFIAIAVRPDLPEYEKINIALLDTTSSELWRDVVARYLGPEQAGL